MTQILNSITQELKVLKNKIFNPIKFEDIQKCKKEINWTLKRSQQLENPFYIIKSSPWPTLLGLTASFTAVNFIFNILHADAYSTRKITDKIWNTYETLNLPVAGISEINTPSFNLLTELSNPLFLLFRLPIYAYNLVMANFWQYIKPMYIVTDLVISLFTFQIIPTLTIVIFFMSIYGWFKDMIIEGTFEGRYTSYVQWNIKCGFLLFIASEIMFFFGLFWTYFYAALSPSSSIGGVWPPKGIDAPDPLGLPLLNTLILLYSGLMINISLKAIRARQRPTMLIFLFLTICLGVGFEILQVCEYCWLKFCISDSVYGSIFYMTTGTHGIHVLVGLTWLIISFFRALKHHFRADSHLNIKLAAWYWHFVDIVWILVYLVYYWWT